jgi:hypothetical protein
MRARYVFMVPLLVAAGQVAAQPANPPDRDTIRFVSALRNPDGGYAPAPAQPGIPVRSSLRATTAAVRALKYLGGELKDPATTAKFVEGCFDKATSGFGDFPGEAPTVGTTAVGIMTIIDLNQPPAPFRDAVVKYLNEHIKTDEDIRIAAATFEAMQMRSPKAGDWLKQIAAGRNADGTFGTGSGIARATGGTAALILRFGGTVENRDAVLRAMRAGQRPDGGFGSAECDGSDLESTYRVMRAFAMMKELPADPAKLRSFMAKCRSEAGGYGVMPGQPPTAAGTYYAAIISHWLDLARAR